jgi:hypothetical protein
MTRSTIFRSIAFATALAMSAGMSFAETGPATAIADGQPWSAIGPNGQAMILIFYPDGQVRAKLGIMRMSMTWEPTTDGLCLSGGPGGQRCITFIKTETGYQGIENGQVTLQLSR